MEWEAAQPGRSRRPRGGRVGALAALIGAVVLVTLLVRTAESGGGPTVPDTSGRGLLHVRPAPDPVPVAGGRPRSFSGTWRLVPDAPLSGRVHAASAWTGEEVLIWGGQGAGGEAADGAGFDPERRRWRALPEAPLSGRALPGAVWTGEEMIVWGGVVRGRALADGAAYQPAGNRWRPLGASPLRPRLSPAVVWTGHEVLIWGGVIRPHRDRAVVHLTDGAAYDPSRDRWRMLPRAPGAAPEQAIGSAVWTGEEFVVVSGHQARAFDPERATWRLLPPPPAATTAADRPGGVWTGEEVLAFTDLRSHDRSGMAYSPGLDRWRDLPPLPASDPCRQQQAQRAGEQVLVWPESGNVACRLASIGQPGEPWDVLDPTPLRLPRFGAAVHWTGEALVVWGGHTLDGAAADGALWRP